MYTEQLKIYQPDSEGVPELCGGSATHYTSLLPEDSFIFSRCFILVRVVVVPREHWV